jgi:hypothetical protein
MMDTCFNIAIVALIVFVVVSTIRAVSAPKGEQERRAAILRIIVSVVGIGFILVFRSVKLSLWHYLIVGGTLILIHRELRNRQQTCMSIYGNARKNRLALIVGAALGLIVFIHSPWTVKLGLSVLLIVILVKKRSPRHAMRETPEPHGQQTETQLPSEDNVGQNRSDVTHGQDAEQFTTSPTHASTGMADTETEAPSSPDANVIRALSDATSEVDADQVTASYAHPTTGLAHTDAALQVYTSSEAGPAKSQARRIIIAGLTKTVAFKTEDHSLDDALRDIVVTSDPDLLKDKLQVLPERLAQLAETEAERLAPIKQKVLTVLHIVQIIAEDQDKQSQVQATETLIKLMDAAEPRAHNEDSPVDPAL